MKTLLGPRDLQFFSLNTLVICYVANVVIPDACLTRKQGDVGSSPSQGSIPGFSDGFVEKKKLPQFVFCCKLRNASSIVKAR